jgi:hypothetical protein
MKQHFTQKKKQKTLYGSCWMKVTTTKLCSIEQRYLQKNGCSSPKIDDCLLSSNKTWREKTRNEMKNDDNACKTL